MVLSEKQVDTVLFLLFAVCLVTGTFVVGVALFPIMAKGPLISARMILLAGLTFVGGVLALLAVLPDAENRDGRKRTGRTGDEWSVQALVDEIDATVFGAGVLLPVAFVALLLVIPEQMSGVVAETQSMLTGTANPLLFGSVLLFVLFTLAVAASPWGRIKLGDESEKPEYSFWSYFAMMFSAGIAAGIVFWGPAEAIYHYSTVPPYLGATPESAEAATGALQYTMFHWGFSAWSAYLVVGLPIGYFAYTRDAPLRVSTLLAPFLGVENLDSPVAKLVDVLAVFATIGGISTSLGFVSNQLLTGIEYQWDVTFGSTAVALLIASITVIFVLSVASGVKRGIRRIASLNAGLFLAVLALTFLLGPTVFILGRGAGAFGSYLLHFFPMSVYTGGAGGGDWVSAWTAFYWAWWLSWAPFAGLFLARISRGRRVRTVVLTTVGATSLATLAWFTVVGATSIHFQQTGVTDILGIIGAQSVAVSGFPLFGALPIGDLLVLLFLGLVVTFFVTSADSSTLSLALLTASGSPSAPLRVFWGILQGAIAVVLIVNGGATTLQSAAIITGGPFALVGLVSVAGMVKTFREATKPDGGRLDATATDTVSEDD
jgi:choline/carnitine/betaine transport